MTAPYPHQHLLVTAGARPGEVPAEPLTFEAIPDKVPTVKLPPTAPLGSTSFTLPLLMTALAVNTPMSSFTPSSLITTFTATSTG
mgnify:CR=1 FL=1